MTTVALASLHCFPRYVLNLYPVTLFLLSEQALTPQPACLLPGGARGRDAPEDAPEVVEDCPLHGAGQLPALAGAHTPEDTAVYLRADPPVPQRKPLHHKWLQGSPALQALPEEVGVYKNVFTPSKSFIMQHYFISSAVFLFCPTRQ